MHIVFARNVCCALCLTTASVAQDQAAVPQIDITAVIAQMPRVEIKVELVPTPNSPVQMTTVVTFTFVNFGTTTVRDVWIEPLDPHNGSTLGRLHAPVIVVDKISSATALFPGAHSDARFGGIIECKDAHSLLRFRRGINRALSEDELNINTEIEPRSHEKRLQNPDPPAKAPVPPTPIPNVMDLGCSTIPIPSGIFL